MGKSFPAHLDYPRCTMYQLVAAAAEKYPGSTAYTFMGRNTSYRAFLARVDAAAKGLYRLGIRRGDRVTICMANTPQAVDCFYACNRIGAVPNMVHPLSAPGELAFCLDLSRSKAILTLDQFYSKVAGILPRQSGPVTILIARVSEELPLPLRAVYPLTADARAVPRLPETGYTLWTDMVRAGRGLSLPPDRGTADDCAAILYSGGTTGNTKGILLSNLNFNALGLQTIAASGYDTVAGMKMLSMMPLFHGFGLGIGIHTALIGGAACILVPRFSIETYANVLKRQKPNIIPGVPTLFEALLRAEGLQNTDLSFLKGIFCGGDSLSPELKDRVDRFLKAHGCAEQIREGYGMTECVTASCLTPKESARRGSIGLPFPDTFYKIVKPGTTQALPAGTEGEICVCGPTVMLGYLDDPAETASVLKTHSDGRVWLHTGDLGAIDSDGFIYFHQRLKRMIVSSGYNIYPSRLEQVLDSHEKVLRSCVIGVKDPYRGQIVRAYVVPVPGVEPSLDLKAELLTYCAGKIAKYALPRQIEFRTALPKTSVGKVAYRVLEAEAEAGS